MTRDMDLIRELLLKLEALPIRPGGVVHIPSGDEDVVIAGHGVDQIDCHLSLLIEAGLIDNGGGRPFDGGIGFRRLTWSGHDFLDTIRDPEIWAKTKRGAFAAGVFTFDLLKELAKGFLKKQIAERAGVEI